MLLSPARQTRALLDTLIRAGLIAVLVISCYRIFHPFVDLLLWSLILGVTLYPLHCRLRRRLGGREGRAATVLVLLAIGLLMVPVYLLGLSVAASVESGLSAIQGGKLHIPPPADAVASWPLVGKPLFEIWQQAATDLASLTQRFAPQIKAISFALLAKFAGFGVGLLMFIVALALAGVIMAYADGGRRAAVQAASRVVGPDEGLHITELCTAIIRAVAQGVIGIAFIQMLLIGVGFVLMGVPGAGLLALAVLLLGIMQVPATLVTLPVIVYVIATDGVSVATVGFSVYVFVAGLVDNVLKPLLLGRGVDVPMPVVLIGALGGMVNSGIIGLFIGPVILAVGYELFWRWVRDQPQVAGSAALEPTAEIPKPT